MKVWFWIQLPMLFYVLNYDTIHLWILNYEFLHCTQGSSTNYHLNERWYHWKSLRFYTIFSSQTRSQIDRTKFVHEPVQYLCSWKNCSMTAVDLISQLLLLEDLQHLLTIILDVLRSFMRLGKIPSFHQFTLWYCLHTEELKWKLTLRLWLL